MNISSARMHSNLLVPAFGFQSMEQAISARDGLDSVRAREHGIGIVRGAGGKVYILHPEIYPGYQLSTADILLSRRWEERNSTCWIRLGEQNQCMLQSASNVCLLLNGRREFNRKLRNTSERSKLWYELTNGQRDCFAVWSTDQTNQTSHMIPQVSGQGAIYSCEQMFDDDGGLMNYRHIYAVISFKIRDFNPSKDDMLCVNVDRAAILSTQKRCRKPDVLSEDPSQSALLQSAVDGFWQNCQPFPEEMECWRQEFLAQKAKLGEDLAKPHGLRYGSMVLYRSLERSLKRVCEPWQLKLVIDVHLKGLDRESVLSRIAECRLPDSQRSELEDMYASFVEVVDAA